MHDLPADRAFNVLDTIIVDEAIRNGQIDGGLEKARTMIYSVYNRRQGSSNDEYGASSDARDKQPTLTWDDTEDGYFGLEPPMG